MSLRVIISSGSHRANPNVLEMIRVLGFNSSSNLVFKDVMAPG